MNFTTWIENREEQYDKATKALMALYYTGINVTTASDKEILGALEKLGKTPTHVSPLLFVHQLRSIANDGFNPDQDLDSRRTIPVSHSPI